VGAVPAELSLVNVKIRNAPEIDFEPDANYPERRLWLAVIVQALADYEDLLRKVESAWNHLQRPTQRQQYLEVKQLQRHLADPLFELICEHAGIAVEKVARKVRRFEKDYCFNAIPVEDDAPVLSDWQMRKVRRARQA
jgi:hypothetical protein